MFSKELHSVVKTALEEVLGHLEALQLVHGLNLLFTLSSGDVERLVLLLDAADFALDLLNPVLVGLLLAFVVFTFEFADFLQFSFLFYLKERLFDRLGEEDIEDGLHFSIIVKEVVVLDLGDLVNTGLLGHVLGRWRLGCEVVRLTLNFDFLGLFTPLLLQEVSEVDLNPGWITRSQVVRTGLGLLLFEFY